MNTKNWTRHLAWGVLGLVSQQVYSQASQADNNGGFSSFLGWNAGANQVLEVKNEANQPIEWYTDAVRRMLLQESATYTIGPFATQAKNGSLLLSPDVDQFYTEGGPGPYSLLHLAAANNNDQQNSYRPWMDIGITFTGNADHGYVGQKHGELDYTDMIIHWSDNPGEFLKDRLRILFTSGYDPNALSGAQSKEGLEFMRFFPNRYEDPFVGVGDFYAANLFDPTITEPTERLDVVNGRLRIRQLPQDPEALDRYKVMVVDASSNVAENGVVKWVDPSVFTNAPGCEWTMDATAPNHVYTAFGPANPDCPDAAEAVGVGVDLGATAPTGKVMIRTNVFERGLDVATIGGTAACTGLQASAEGNAGSAITYGVAANTSGQALTAHGIKATAQGATYSSFGGAFVSHSNAPFTWGATGVVYAGSGESIGVEGLNLANAANNRGVKGVANASSSGTTSNYFGVYGHASKQGSSQAAFGVYGSAPQATNSWAGWFEGDVMINGNGFLTGMVPIVSDASLKTNVQPLVNAMGLIDQLEPSTYEMLIEAHPTLSLSAGPQYGLIAQELEAVLPDLVSDVTIPAMLDSLGNVEHEQLTIKAVNYLGLVPLLIAALKEQQVLITTMQETYGGTNDILLQAQAALAIQSERIDALESLVNHCCGEVDGLERVGEMLGTLPVGADRLLRIVPNPFNAPPTIQYTLERDGRMQLMVTGGDGRSVRVLEEGQRTAGAYQYDWNTNHLAPGIYYVTLLLDGEPLVQRAVKL